MGNPFQVIAEKQLAASMQFLATVWTYTAQEVPNNRHSRMTAFANHNEMARGTSDERFARTVNLPLTVWAPFGNGTSEVLFLFLPGRLPTVEPEHFC